MNYKKTKSFLCIMPPWGIQTPPVGIASLATYLKKHNLLLAVSDFNISLYNKYRQSKAELWNPGNKIFWVMDEHFPVILKAFSADIDALVKQIIKADFDFICFSVFSDNRLFTVEVIKRLRKANVKGKIIVGGVGCFSKNERDAFGKGTVDAFVIGEGEETLLNLIKYYTKDISDTPAFVISNDFSYHECDRLSNLDELGFPDFSEFNMREYTNKSLAVSFSRGCVMQCRYCNDRKVMGVYRQKSAKSMFEQLKFYVSKMNVREFAINDLQLNADIKRLKEFCQLIIDDGMRIQWTANMMPSDKMDKEVVQSLKKAGCKSIIFGVESASENVLTKMNRKFTIATVQNILKYFKEVGIESWVNIIVGYPGETREDFEETLRFLNDNYKYISKVSVLNKCNIVHNSKLYEEADKFGIRFPAEKSYEEVRWTSLDGNNEALRDLRLQRTIIALDKLNVPVLQTNVKYSDPIAADDVLSDILGDIAFVRDSRNIMIDENDDKAVIVNAYLKSINEILDYKEMQIKEIINYKHKEVEAITARNTDEKEKIVAKYDDQIASLVKESEDKLKEVVSLKDKEIEELSDSYITRESNLVKENDKKISVLVREKDAEFEDKFNSFKEDMEKNIAQKEELLQNLEQLRVSELESAIANKDAEIESITDKHVEFIKDLVEQKDNEINEINDKYKQLLIEKERLIIDLKEDNKEKTDEIERIKNSKLFRLRQFIKKYFFI